MKLNQVLTELKKNSCESDRQGMARFGINPKYALGIRIPVLRNLAKKIGKDHSLAKQLWATKIHEARILACMIENPSEVSEKQMDEWIKEFNSWDLCDQCCMNLFDRLPFAYAKAIKLAESKDEFVKRAGFALMAVFAVHRKDLKDSDFIRLFPIIIKNSTDERNFVRKAVNWVLRQIGKRNSNLKKEAIRASEEILKRYPDSKSAVWIAKDALKELKSN